MTLDEFWEISFNEDNVLEHYEGVKQLFSKPLEEEIPDNYDISYPLIDIKGYLKDLGEYARMEELLQAFKANCFEAYEKVFYYYRVSLTEHYLHENDREGLEKCVTDFGEMPIEGYDNMMQALRKMQVYGHIDLVDRLICEIYDTTVASDQLAEGASFDLALIKSHVELEKVYVKYKEKGEFEWDEYSETLPKFGFETEDRFFKLCEMGLAQPFDKIEERVRADFEQNRGICIELLEKAFMKYMLDEKDMPFALSALIWNYLYAYWEEMDRGAENPFDIDYYFDFEADSYKYFVKRYSGFIMDYRFLSVAILWGTCYVYDFLKRFNLIAGIEYEPIQTSIKEYKYDLIYENLRKLWHYSFVNDWKKSEMETDEEKQKISAIFDEYYNADQEKIHADKRGYFFSEPYSTPEWLERTVEAQAISSQPIKAAPKIGRNEKVTVEYKDGTIKKDVKYKKVQKDVEMRACKII